ncbi:MAG: PorT family protein [Muribaculum sp.]|nr:PorT family protein [Muribaculum sp.]
MNRILSTIIGIIISVSALSAQSIFNSGNNKAGFGVRLSYELACPGDVELSNMLKSDVYGNASGVNIGAVYHLPVIFNFYFEPGVAIAYNQYTLDRDYISWELSSSTDVPLKVDADGKVKMWDIRFPILGGYRFDLLPFLGINIFTGPEVQFGLSAKNHFKVNNLNVVGGAYGKNGQLNRTDVKWRIGAGVTFHNHLYGAISGAIGLCDQARDDYKLHSNLFDITVGYNF